MKRLISALRLALALAAGSSSACKTDAPTIVGVWKNGAGQILTISADLTGRVEQRVTCTPALNVTVHRDPFDAYAIQFRSAQEVYFPAELVPNYGGNQYYCTSSDSVPMCDFCRVDGTKLHCDAPAQNLIDYGNAIAQDCAWEAVHTASTASTLATTGCTKIADAGGCGATSSAPDAGIADAAAADAAATDGGDAGR